MRVLVLICILNITSAWAASKETLGWVEKVRISPANLILQGKLDTGADTSSLHAANVERFERDGKTWVRFVVENRQGEKATIEKEVLRTALVKRQKGATQKRDVIRLGTCLGKTYLEIDVSLVDRRKFSYQMLIGRNFLAGNVLVDPAMTFTTDPQCKETTKK